MVAKFDKDFDYFELETPIEVQGSFEKDFSIEAYPGLKGYINEVRVTKGVARYSVRKTFLNRIRTWLYYKMPWLPSWVTGWVTWKFRKNNLD